MEIAIVGEFDQNFRPHIATNEAIEHSSKLIDVDFAAKWISTDYIETNFEQIIERYDGFGLHQVVHIKV